MLELSHDGSLGQEVHPGFVCGPRLQGFDGYKHVGGRVGPVCRKAQPTPANVAEFTTTNDRLNRYEPLKSMITNLSPLKNKPVKMEIQIPTRTPEKIVVALFSGILVNSGIQVKAGRHIIGSVNSVNCKLKAQ